MATPLPTVPYSENNNSYEILRYPYEIIGEKTDYFQIAISEYYRNTRRGYGGLIRSGDPLSSTPSSEFAAGPKASTVKTNQFIVLPMPSNIQDGNSVSYSDDSLNGFTAAALGSVTNMISSSIFDSEGQQTMKNSFNALIDQALSPEMRKIINRTIAAEAVNIFGGNVTPQQIVARETGQIFNPNMELLFNSTTLRNFKFSFKMTPRNETESKEIKKIIRTLKKYMAPDYVSEKFLYTPNVFSLAFKKGDINHPYLNTFKPCFLTDMAVNYTGENVYATYSDGAPISMIMDLSFKEIVPIYTEDYDEGVGSEGVGY